jgi:hypothetical protein
VLCSFFPVMLCRQQFHGMHQSLMLEACKFSKLILAVRLLIWFRFLTWIISEVKCFSNQQIIITHVYDIVRCGNMHSHRTRNWLAFRWSLFVSDIMQIIGCNIIYTYGSYTTWG